MTTLTCDHCESEIDVALDPRCVVYDPSSATKVICKKCRELAFNRWHDNMFKDWRPDITERVREAYRIKRGWRA